MTQQPAADPVTAEALDWFVRLQAAGADPATSRAFRAWLDAGPRHAEAFEKVAAVWGAPEFIEATKNVAKATGYAGVAKKPRRKSPVKKSVAKKAAGVASVLLIAMGLTQLPELQLRLQADYITPSGKQRSVTLPDGSRMTLNTGSAVALDFTATQRDVRVLKGEVYFDVKPGLPVPFRVAGAFGDVKVTGTAFAVRLDGGEDNIVLSHGRVEVSRRDHPRDHTALSPGQSISVTATTMLPPRKVDTSRSLAWLDGRISFHDQPLGDVLNDLRRYHGGQIFVLNKSIEAISVSGNYEIAEPLQVMRSLSDAAGVTMTTLPGGIVILR